MLDKWIPAIAGGQPIAVKFTVVTFKINTVRVRVSIPCRKGQYVILHGVNESDFNIRYYNSKCIVSWLQDTNNMRLSDLLTDVTIWFRYSTAIRFDAEEYVYKELIRVF